MKKEYDYTKNNYKKLEEEYARSMQQKSEAEKMALNKKTKEDTEKFLQEAFKIIEEERKGKVQIFDDKMYRIFLRTIKVLRERAEIYGDRLVVEIRDDKSFGYIKYFTGQIIHTNDESGDRTRQLFGKLFLQFNGIEIYPHGGDELEIMISQYFTKWVKVYNGRCSGTKSSKVQEKKGRRLLRRGGIGRKKMC